MKFVSLLDFYYFCAIIMDSSVENVENYTKEIPKMCKTPHFPHFNKNTGICLTERLFTN